MLLNSFHLHHIRDSIARSLAPFTYIFRGYFRLFDFLLPHFIPRSMDILTRTVSLVKQSLQALLLLLEIYIFQKKWESIEIYNFSIIKKLQICLRSSRECSVDSMLTWLIINYFISFIYSIEIFNDYTYSFIPAEAAVWCGITARFLRFNSLMFIKNRCQKFIEHAEK